MTLGYVNLILGCWLIPTGKGIERLGYELLVPWQTC